MSSSSDPGGEDPEDIVALDAAWTAFHQGQPEALADVFAGLAARNNSYRSDLARRLLVARPVTEVTADALGPWMGRDVAGLRLTPELAAGWQRLLEAPVAEKVRLLSAGLTVGLTEGGAEGGADVSAADPGQILGAAFAGGQAAGRLNGTLMVDVPFIGLTLQGTTGTGRILLLSLQSPLDALYLPDLGLMVHASALRFSAAERVQKLLAWILYNPEAWLQFWTRQARGGLRFLIRDKRPYHVLLDELSGHLELHEQGFDLPVVYMARAAFVETAETLAPPGAEKAERGIFEPVIVTSHRRADKDDFGLRFHDWLRARARAHMAAKRPADAVVPRGDGPADPRPLIWIGIAGGEKRRWFEEEAGLIAVIDHIRARLGPCRFVFDGWTAPLHPTDKDAAQITQHIALRDRILAATGLGPDDHQSVIGTGILTKVDMARQAAFFVSCGGTPSVWPSLVCGVPGVVHNSRSMLARVGQTYRPANVIRVPDAMIEDVNEVGEAIRWDRYSYHIAVEDFLACVDEALDLTVQPRTPAAFQAALIAARKARIQGRVEALEAQCRITLKTYRNLKHVLESSAFFGRPEVEILDDTPGVCRVVDCDTRISSDTVFVTFGKVSSNIDHIPFGYPFLTRQGFRHIHVAQVRRTSYQTLDLDGFAERIAPLVADYRYRFTVDCH